MDVEITAVVRDDSSGAANKSDQPAVVDNVMVVIEPSLPMEILEPYSEVDDIDSFLAQLQGAYTFDQ